MPYCPRCGVEVEDRLGACPLCDTDIPKEVRVDPAPPGDFPDDVIPHKPLYRDLTKKQQRFLMGALVLFLTLFPIFITVGTDLSDNGRISWSYYVMVPLLGSSIIAMLFMKFAKKPIISVTLTMLVVFVVQMMLETPPPGQTVWDTPILPFFTASFIAVEIILLVLVYIKPGTLKTISVILVDTALLLGAIDFIIYPKLTWSLITASSIIPVAIYLFYLKSSKKKGMNLLGFAFADMALLLIFLNLSISRDLSWSIMTTIIFIPVAILFYVLHVVLFNDTDWRKALHL